MHYPQVTATSQEQRGGGTDSNPFLEPVGVLQPDLGQSSSSSIIMQMTVSSCAFLTL